MPVRKKGDMREGAPTMVVETDGTVDGTALLDRQGNMVPGVVGLSWRIDSCVTHPVLTVEFVGVKIKTVARKRRPSQRNSAA